MVRKKGFLGDPGPEGQDIRKGVTLVVSCLAALGISACSAEGTADFASVAGDNRNALTAEQGDEDALGQSGGGGQSADAIGVLQDQDSGDGGEPFSGDDQVGISSDDDDDLNDDFDDDLANFGGDEAFEDLVEVDDDDEGSSIDAGPGFTPIGGGDLEDDRDDLVEGSEGEDGDDMLAVGSGDGEDEGEGSSVSSGDGLDDDESDLVDNGSTIPNSLEPQVLIQGQDDDLISSLNLNDVPFTSQINQEFSTEQRVPSQVSVDLNQQSVSQTLTMVRSQSESQRTVEQVDRPVVVDSIRQGQSGDSINDVFQQDNPVSLLDILVVIDNSGSMEQEQQNLSTKLQPLLSFVEDSDWRIGVVTTDYRDPCVRDIINKYDPNASQDFADAISAGTSGYGVEAGFYQARRALEGTCLQQPWLRDGSSLAVLFVSDEDNCSLNGTGCPTDPSSDVGYLTEYMSTIRTLGTDAKIYGIIYEPGSTCSTGRNESVQYSQVISSTGGQSGSICSDDYSSTLSAISFDISQILRDQFVLTRKPDEGSALIKVNGVEQNNGFNLVGQTLTFVQAPPAGAQIEVSYVTGARTILSSVNLQQSAVESSLNVSIDGNSLSSNDFSLSDDGTRIDFDSTPPENSDIQVQYRVNSTLPNSIEVAPNIVPGSLSVSVEGVVLDPLLYSYDGGSGSVIFATAPGDGASLEFSYRQWGDPVLRYSFTSPIDASYLNVLDSQTQTPVVYSLSDDHIVFPANEFVENRQIQITGEIFNTDDLSLTVGQTPILGTLNLVQGDQSCVEPELSVVDGDKLVSLAGCGLISLTGGAATLSFDSIVRVSNPFVLSDDEGVLDDLGTQQVWSVFADGVLTTDFTIEGRSVLLGESVNSSKILRVQIEIYNL